MREALKQSHVAGLMIAILLFWVVGNLWEALWTAASRLAEFLATAIAIRGIPYYAFTGREMFDLESMFLDTVLAGAFLLGASWISNWVYGMGPIRALKGEGKLLLRTHARTNQTITN
jgi:hypothetical protein